jgi:hypothetical protein
MDRGRRLQIAADRAGRRWSRRVSVRIKLKEQAARDKARILEDQGEAMFRRLMSAAPPDPMIAQLKKAQEVEDLVQENGGEDD